MQVYDKRTTPARPDLAAANLRGKVTAARFAEGTLRRVNDALLDLRREPTHESPLETQALHGEEVIVYEENEGWAWLQLQRDAYVGYAAAAGLAPPRAGLSTHRIIVPRTFVYARPSIKSSLITALPLGSAVTVAETSGDLAALADGGFAWAAHLAPLDEPTSDFVTAAEQFLQAPYLWGGKTSLGLDCSALVQVSLAAAGLAAPRDTDLQERALGEPLAFDDRLDGLRRGDLIFWKGHVGIMRDATALLHASGHHMLVTSELLRTARDRIHERSFGAIASIKRLIAAR